VHPRAGSRPRRPGRDHQQGIAPHRPVNFIVFNEAVYFRTEPGTKLDAATAGSVVAFQADAYAPDGSAGWSVLAIGPCRRVDEGAEGLVASGASDRLTAWPLSGHGHHTVRVDLVTVTGRRFGDLENPWLLLH